MSGEKSSVCGDWSNGSRNSGGNTSSCTKEVDVITRLITFISWAVLTVTAFIIIVITYWLIWPYRIMEINQVKVLTPVVNAGDEVQVWIDSIKYTSMPATVLREIINDHAWSFPPTRTNVAAGKSDWTLRIKVPFSAPTGSDYRVHTTYVYKVNPLREVVVEWQTQPFAVIGSLGNGRH